MTTLGTSNGRVPLRTGGVGVGERVLVTKGIAIKGTAILAQAWARNESAPDVSHHIQRLLDIPLERFGRLQPLPVRLNVTTASPQQLKTLTAISEDQAEKISQGCPCQHNDELVTRQILSRNAYDTIKDLITVE
ncbi:MAG: hypothetical protein OEV27_09795 [Nitrospira sp.]|nr:hypothetical protein [Nitrospira sp.]MDH4251468.1 hypothetical protein [Nitrospira sp.]